MRLKGVRRQKRGDRVVKYHRASGVRLPDLPELHPEFIDAWAKAEAGLRDPSTKVDRAKAVRPGSVAAAIRALRLTRGWREVSDAYRGVMERHLGFIADLYGSVMFSSVQAHHIEADLAKLEPNPANERLKAWKMLCKAAKGSIIRSDPSIGIKKITVRSKGHTPWSAADVARYRDTWAIGTPQRAAFELLQWTGARTADAVVIGPADIDDAGVLAFDQTKTLNPAHVPWTCAIPDWADWDDERRMVFAALECLAGGDTFLAVGQKRQRSVKGIGNLVNDAARDSGLRNRTCHGLRKYRLTMVAEASGSAYAVKAWGGHKTLAEAQKYTESANLKRLISSDRQKKNVVSQEKRDTITDNTSMKSDVEK